MTQKRSIGPYQVFPVGLGGMYMSITGRPDEAQSIATIHAALDAGVDFIDTANVYCLDQQDIGHNERLIAKALEGRKEKVLIATKGGLERPNGSWTSSARPASLVSACEASLKALALDAIDVYQLHAVDSKVPLAESVGALAKLKEQGKIKHVALSNVSVREIEEALKIVPIVSIQNRWNPKHRSPERDGVLAFCEKHGIAFLPYSPFGGASGAKSLGNLGILSKQAVKFGVSPHRLVIAWMLAKSPVVIPIPGARRSSSIVDSAQATEMTLTASDLSTIEASF